MSAHRLALPLSLLRIAAQFLARMQHRLLAANGLARSRRGLKLLDDHLLKDIGLTRAEALTEAERSRWDAPTHWKG